MQKTIAKLTLERLRQPVADQLVAMDLLIKQQLTSGIPLIAEVTNHMLQSGGKRIRPLLLLLVAGACGYRGIEHIELAVVVEFIHAATLLHDDVVDNSARRRGMVTAHQMFSTKASILVGDFLYSRAFQLLSKRSNVQAMQFLAEVSNSMSEGEVLQLMQMQQEHSLTASKSAYYQVIDAKTAGLFAASAYMGALLAEQQQVALMPGATAMAEFGRQLGLAYQIIDDVLDYVGDEAKLGKQVGDDLVEGKMTLPLIHCMQHADNEVAAEIRQIMLQKRRVDIHVIVQAMQQTGAVYHCRRAAEQHMAKAEAMLSALPESACRDALYNLMQFLLWREG